MTTLWETDPHRPHSIAEVSEAFRDHDLPAFEQRFGWFYLLWSEPTGKSLSDFSAMPATNPDGSAGAAANARETVRIDQPAALDNRTWVFRLPFQDNERLVVGRARTDARVDVPVPVDTVSERHAVLQRITDAVAIADLGSRHGTRVDDVSAPREGEAPAPRARAGSVVHFGSARMMLLDAAQLRRFVRE